MKAGRKFCTACGTRIEQTPQGARAVQQIITTSEPPVVQTPSSSYTRTQSSRASELTHAVKTGDFIPSGSQIRPWMRYLARGIDFTLFGCFIGLVLGFFFPKALEIDAIVITPLLLFIYVFEESFLLSLWGTTPGKALLNIRLRKNDGTKPNYLEALKRSSDVFIRGFGLGLPIISFFTQIYAYRELTKYGIAPWDKDGGFQIRHKLLGPGRIIASIAITVGLCFIIALGYSEH